MTDLSMATNVDFEYDSTILIDLSFETVNNESLEDISGNNNIGILISDYVISFDEDSIR